MTITLVLIVEPICHLTDNYYMTHNLLNLADFPWFCSLNQHEQDKVRQAVTCKSFAEGEFIARKGDATNAWVGVVDGLVKINTFSASGKCITFTGVPTGGWIGEGSVIKREDRKYDIIALRQSYIAFLPTETFHWLLDNSLHFNRFVIQHLNERLSQVLGTLESDRLHNPDARVAHALCAMFNRQLFPDAAPQVHISQEELGYIVGTSRQRVNQSLKTLEERGLIHLGYGFIGILDLAGLQQCEFEE